MSARAWSLPLLLVLPLLYHSYASAKSTRIALATKVASDHRLQLSADKLQLHQPTKGCSNCTTSLKLSGKVRVIVGSMTLRAGSMELTLSQKGHATRAIASGQVKVTLGRRTARAISATLGFDPPSVELRGKAQLVCPKLGVTLTGERIAVNLADGQVVVNRARAKLTARSGASR